VARMGETVVTPISNSCKAVLTYGAIFQTLLTKTSAITTHL